jgi:hypothetical protein
MVHPSSTTTQKSESTASPTPISMFLPSVTPTQRRAATASLAPTSSATDTPLSMPTHSQSPTRTPKPTLQWPEYPPLNPEGPYIAVGSWAFGSLILNPDGSGLGKIDFPIETINDKGDRQLSHFRFSNVSPDGKWALVYHGGQSYDVDKNLSLSLVDLTDGWNYLVAVILPQSAREARYDSYECSQPYYDDHFYQAVWSPDGRYLAFAAYSPWSDSLELFIVEVPYLSVHQLTNDHAEIEAIRWSPSGDRIYFTSGHDFDINNASSSSFSLNVTRPENYTNEGIQTLAYSKDRIMVEGFDGNIGVVYAAHENDECPSGAFPTINGIRYLNVFTNETTAIWSGTLFTESLVIDHINRAVFFASGFFSPDDFMAQARIVTYEGKIISTIDTQEYILCGKALLLGGPKYAYLCSPFGGGGGPSSILGISFGGKIDVIAEDGEVSVSPDRKWFYIVRGDISLYSRDTILVTSFGENYDSTFWAPDGKGLYLVPDGKKILYYSFADGKTSIIFSCPFDSYCINGGLLWIP